MSASSTNVKPVRGSVQVDSPNAVSIQPAPHSASVTQIESLGRGTYAVLIGGVILAALLAGMAFVRTEATADRAALAEREARVLQERWNDLKVELAKRGIPVSDH